MEVHLLYLAPCSPLSARVSIITELDSKVNEPLALIIPGVTNFLGFLNHLC